jgi:hypothetical protein
MIGRFTYVRNNDLWEVRYFPPQAKHGDVLCYLRKEGTLWKNTNGAVDAPGCRTREGAAWAALEARLEPVIEGMVRDRIRCGPLLRKSLELPLDVAHIFWTILVQECGACEEKRSDFVEWATNPERARAMEYRFGGVLGFGGKIFLSLDRVYITQYLEDETVETRWLIARANRLIAEYCSSEFSQALPVHNRLPFATLQDFLLELRQELESRIRRLEEDFSDDKNRDMVLAGEWSPLRVIHAADSLIHEWSCYPDEKRAL